MSKKNENEMECDDLLWGVGGQGMSVRVRFVWKGSTEIIFVNFSISIIIPVLLIFYVNKSIILFF